jgi:hypothetical protein
MERDSGVKWEMLSRMQSFRKSGVRASTIAAEDALRGHDERKRMHMRHVLND